MSSIPQRLILGLEHSQLDNQAGKFIKDHNPGGIILFDRNGENTDQLKKLLSDIRRHCADQPFIAIDFEGGRVRRLSSLFGELKSPPEYRSLSLDILTSDCLNIAAQFRECGINLSFAPVADLEYEPLNPALKGRVYSDECSEVAEYCLEFIKAFERFDVMCCLKHFPGLGSAVNDPHEKASISCLPLDWLMVNDFVPFKAGINAGVNMIMTSHILAGSLDNKVSTFSRKTTELVRRMGFQGILITDDMSMGAVGHDDLTGNILKALVAGHDMALVCHDFKKYEDVIIYLEKKTDLLVKNGHDEALSRIKNAKEKHLKRFS